MKEQRFESVWDAVENSPAEAANMKARSDVMIAIREVVDKWRVYTGRGCEEARDHPAAAERSCSRPDR